MNAPNPPIPQEFRDKYVAAIAHGINPFLNENVAHMSRLMKMMPPNARALEVGCFNGGTTVWLLENGINQLWFIDTFKGSPEHVGLVDTSKIREEFEKNVSIYRGRVYGFYGRSDTGLARMFYDDTKRFLDFIYIDASHDSRDVIVDATLAFRLLKPGGIMCFDDYEWNYYPDKYRNPKPAIDFFLAAYAPDLEVIERGYQISVRKL